MSEPVAEFSIAADAGEFRRASAWLEEAARERRVPADQIGRLDLCLNEVLANIVAHGGARALTARIGLQLAVHSDGTGREAIVTVSDGGFAFDPLAVHSQPRPKSLAEAEPGGLGVLMLRSFADTFAYRYSDGRNHLSFGVRWAMAR